MTEGKSGVRLIEAKKLALKYDDECVRPWGDVEHLRKIYFVALCIQTIFLIIVIGISNWDAR